MLLCCLDVVGSLAWSLQHNMHKWSRRGSVLGIRGCWNPREEQCSLSLGVTTRLTTRDLKQFRPKTSLTMLELFSVYYIPVTVWGKTIVSSAVQTWWCSCNQAHRARLELTSASPIKLLWDRIATIIPQKQITQGGFCTHMFSHVHDIVLWAQPSPSTQTRSKVRTVSLLFTIPRLPFTLGLSQLTPPLSSAACPQHMGH